MQDIREIELRISGPTQTSIYVLRFKPLLYVSAFTQKDFNYVDTGPPTHGTSTEEYAITKSGVHNSSLQQPPLHKRQDTKSKQQSPLHKIDKGTKPNSTTITSTQEG